MVSRLRAGLEQLNPLMHQFDRIAWGTMSFVLSGLRWFWGVANPGRCPGLMTDCAVGVERPGALSEFLRQMFQWPVVHSRLT
jgi:hypothetical protein